MSGFIHEKLPVEVPVEIPVERDKVLVELEAGLVRIRSGWTTQVYADSRSGDMFYCAVGAISATDLPPHPRDGAKMDAVRELYWALPRWWRTLHARRDGEVEVLDAVEDWNDLTGQWGGFGRRRTIELYKKAIRNRKKLARVS